MKYLKIFLPAAALAAAALYWWWLPDEEKPKWVMAKVDQGAIV